MVTELKPYPEYKDSGVESLGDVPTHWKVLRLKQMCRFAYGDSLADHVRREGAVAVFGSNGRVGFHESANTKAPCIVIGRKGSFGKINYSPDAVFAIDTTFFVDSRFSSANIRWLFFLLGLLHLDDVTRDSAVPGLDRDDAYRRVGVLPPLPEQAAIVRFLDHADRRIRRYIRAKEKLIALLEEQKQSSIQQAVTGQIDVRTGKPYPAYKDSVVVWLGSVPAHWETRRLKTVLRPVDQRSVDGSETLLSLRRDHGVVIYAEHFSRPAQADSLVGFKQVVPGQLVVNRLQANNGLIFCSTLGGLVSPDYSVFERKTAVQTRYLSDLLRTSPYRAHFRRQSTGLGTGTAGFLRVYDDDFLATPVALPSSAEQAAIAAYVDRHVADVATLADRVERQVDIIREYRTRLIADVVTGKLDVQEAVARLPDEGDELEWLNDADDGREAPTDALGTALEEAAV